MAGHNKWSKIKRKKGAEDAKRSKIFSKLVKEIMVAVKEGDSDDIEFNPRLRTAVMNAKGVNMPKDNIERAIKKAGESGGVNFQRPTFEGYAPGGVALFIETTTDNHKRTVANVRAILTKYEGSLGTSGSVEFLFDRKGIFVINEGEFDEDELTLELIDAGAEEVDLEDGEFEITTSMEDFGNLQKALDRLNAEVVNATLQYIPKMPKEVDADAAKSALRLIEALEDDDDVQAVYHDMELSDELVAEMESV